MFPPFPCITSARLHVRALAATTYQTIRVSDEPKFEAAPTSPTAHGIANLRRRDHSVPRKISRWNAKFLPEAFSNNFCAIKGPRIRIHTEFGRVSQMGNLRSEVLVKASGVLTDSGTGPGTEYQLNWEWPSLAANANAVDCIHRRDFVHLLAGS